MSADGSSSSPPAMDKPTQTKDSQMVDQDVKKNDSEIASGDHDKSSSPEIQAAHHQTAATSDDNNPLASEFEAKTAESTKVATTQTQDSVSAAIRPASEVQPTTAPETSISQISEPDEKNPNDPVIPDSDANKPATAISTNELATSSSPKTATTQTPDSDAHDPSTSSQTETSTNNKLHPPPELSPTEGSTSATKQESTAVTQTGPKISSSSEIQQADPPTTTEQNPNTPEQERKHLTNLIQQELTFVKTVCQKLGIHEHRIEKEANEAKTTFDKLKLEPCDLKELKDLKKIVTKLKLQIPAKYRTYNEMDQQENKQSDMDNNVSTKLLKKMPQLHNKLFSDSPFCKTVQKRYDDLPRELRLCLLCFSVFPENAMISRRLMVYWWIAEGLVPMEECGNRYFEELMEKDFIEPVSKKRSGRNVATCKMHPMVRAALVMIADSVKFFDFDEYGNPKDFGKFDEIESPEDVPVIHPLGEPREFFDFYNKDGNGTDETIPFHDSGGNPIQFARRHSMPPADCNGKPIDTTKKYYFYEKKKITTKSYKVCLMGSGLSKGVPWEKLHMLFNVKDDILEFKPEWFLRMENVNVVFLGRWQSSAAHHIEVEEFKFQESLVHMNHVRFFSLQGVSRISELPKSISNLESLLILDLRACHNLETLPKTIGLLKCLTHLDMAECYLLEHMPKEISSLESLQVLKGFVVVESPGKHTCTLNDLRKLGNLRKLSMYTHMKDFPQESHLDALQKFEGLRKLTILWGGHESKAKTDKSKQDSGCQSNLASKMMKLIPKKQWVKGSMRRMNAFNNSTLGSRLEKLDLKCFPDNVTPTWLTPASLKGLEKLYIRGGQFSDLGQYQDVYEWETSPIPEKDTWNVKVLRLKYLDELKMDWRELQTLFPKMTSLEKVKCPRLSLFPCDEHGVWTKKPTTTR